MPKMKDNYGLTGFGFSLVMVGIVVACLAFIAAVVMPISYVVQAKSCDEKTKAMDLSGEFGFWTGCIVDVDGTKIPLDKYIVNSQHNATN